MSYDIYLKDPVTKETLEVENPHFMRGGMYMVGGCRELWLNITYNYARWYYKKGVFPPSKNNADETSEGIRSIYSLTGAESIPILKHAITTLTSMKEDLTKEEKQEYKDQGADGYWLPSRENAIKPLCQLLAMALMRPDGIWDGD